MNALLIEGFTDAYRNLGSTLRLFWPVAAIYLALLLGAWVVGVVATPVSDFVVQSITFVSLVVFLYMFVALCQGAVGWHRRILLHEKQGWISPLPQRRGLQYALAVFAFTIFFMVAHILTTVFVLPRLQPWLLPSMLKDIDFTNASAEQLRAVRKAMLYLNAVMLLISIALFFAILWLGRSWLLVYPHISVRTEQPIFAQIRANLNPSFELVVAMLLVGFAPSVLGYLYWAIAHTSMQFSIGARIVMGIVLCFFCFLWGLSILSIAYRQMTAGDIPYGSDDGAEI